MANPRVFAEQPPRRTPRAGGIKSVVETRPLERGFAAEAIDWQDPGCSFPQPAPGLCWGTVVDAEKTYDGIAELASGPVFALYAGVECFLDGESESEYGTRATALLDTGEDRMIEAILLSYVDGLVTPDAAADLTAAIAALEDTADQDYVGRPILLMNRGDAVQAKKDGVLEGDGAGKLWTPNGTPVIASGSFPTGTISITGDITLYASDAVVTATNHPTLNMAMAIAERAYALAIDCLYAAAITVTP